jgi:hypothetical protein
MTVCADPRLAVLCPLTAMRLATEASRAMASVMPALMLAGCSPFFWAPPLWIGLLMGAASARPNGGVVGSAVSPQLAAAHGGANDNRTLRPPVGLPEPVGFGPRLSGAR